MAEPLVSVIVTTYNRKKYLKETIQSILAQTFTDFELIVVDNFSNYDFFRVIEEFGDSRIRPFQNANNGIIAVNRNFGILKAVGKYLAFCDDDDLWEKEKLAIQMEYVKNSPKVIVSSSFTVIDEESKKGKVQIIKDYQKKYDVYKENLTPLSSVVLTRSKDVFFDEDPCMRTIEDYALWIRLFHKGYGLQVIQKPLMRYRISSSNTLYSLENLKIVAIRRIYLYSKMLIQIPDIPIGVYVRAVLRNLKILIVTIIKNGKFKKFFHNR